MELPNEFHHVLGWLYRISLIDVKLLKLHGNLWVEFATGRKHVKFDNRAMTLGVLQVLHRALVLAYLSELKADIVVELAELENVQVLKEVLSTLMNYSTKKISSTRKGSLTVSSDPQMLHHSRDRYQELPIYYFHSLWSTILLGLLLRQFFNAAYKLDPIPSYSCGPFYTISYYRSKVVRISSVVVSWFCVRCTPLRGAWHTFGRSWNAIHRMPCKTPCMFVHSFKLPWSFRPSSFSVKCP